MKLKVLDADFHLTDCTTRLPFRFGIVTMTHAPLCTARVLIRDANGVEHEGFSADLFAPKWFEKDPEKSIEEDFLALAQSSLAARSELLARKEGATVFEHWLALYRSRVDSTEPDAADRLVRGFGVALLERALMDAACRAAGISFFRALKEDLFGFRPGDALPELAGWDLAAGLPDEPARTVRVRHTVGLVDPLRDRDIEPGERLDDGLPQSFEDNVRRYGLDVFKLKVQGDPERDRERLLAIGAILAEHVPGGATFTLDGNEQFEDLAAVARLLEDVASVPAGARMLEGLLYVEQPLSRKITFDPARNAAMDALTAWAPVIVDEADSGLDSFGRAAALGYRGISVKNCKGVFRALLNRGLCERSGGTLFQSAEDLTNLPVLALQQDLATVAALGFEHVERNGHHYFHGLDHLPDSEARAALAAHPTLYRASDGGVFLDIQNGQLDLRSLTCPGYGHDVPVDVAARTPLHEWVERAEERAR